MATWSITPNDGGANITNGGVVTFQQNTSTSTKGLCCKLFAIFLFCVIVVLKKFHNFAVCFI